MCNHKFELTQTRKYFDNDKYKAYLEAISFVFKCHKCKYIEEWYQGYPENGFSPIHYKTLQAMETTDKRHGLWSRVVKYV